MIFLLRHGWASSHHDMSVLADALKSRGCAVEMDDLGFFDDVRRARIDNDSAYILVGHSYGFASLAREGIEHCLGLVSICGFTRFIHREEQLAELRALRAALQRSPQATVVGFRERCGFDAATPGEPHIERLQTALDDLAQLSIATGEMPILALAAGLDRVVARTDAQAMFANRPFVTYDEHRDAGHDLICAYPQWCAQRILSFAETQIQSPAGPSAALKVSLDGSS